MRSLALRTRHSLSQVSNDFLEHAATMFKVVELVEARAGRGQKHNLPGLGRLKRLKDRLLQVSGAHELGRTGEFLRNAVRGGTDQEYVPDAALDQGTQGRVRRSLVLSAQNQMDGPIKGREGFGGVDVIQVGISIFESL